jgi:hypothetical protein
VNWKTTFTGIASALCWLLALLSTLAAQLSGIASFLPHEIWVKICIVSAVAGAILHSWNGVASADAKPTALPPPDVGGKLSVFDPKKIVLLIASLGFLGLGSAMLASCAGPDGGAHVSTSVPLGSGAKYGSLKLDVGYYPPADFAQWPVALPADFQSVVAQVRDGKTIQLPIK